MKETSIAYDMSALQEAEGIIYDEFDRNDDRVLDKMRSMMRQYVQKCTETKEIKEEERVEYLDKFNQLRATLHDELLREYSSFEFMEKLYSQEYITA